MSILELLKDMITPYTDGEKPPLHIGEAYHLWYYLAGVDHIIRCEQVAYNTAHDEELKTAVEDLITNIHKPMREELLTFLQSEGVPIPPSTPEKPLNGPFLNIPEGAVLSDEEVANLIAWAIVTGIQIGVRGLTESLRPDVAAMFAKNQIMHLTWSITMKNLMHKKGWIKLPPPYQL